jgi:hypothetical protein
MERIVFARGLDREVVMWTRVSMTQAGTTVTVTATVTVTVTVTGYLFWQRILKENEQPMPNPLSPSIPAQTQHSGTQKDVSLLNTFIE